MTAPRIVSASRRTDLPGFHAAWLAARLSAMRRPPDALWIWTKHPGAIARPGALRDAVRRAPNVIVHVTITGLGARDLEPAAPPWRDAVRDAADIAIVLGGDPRRVIWRFDPVIPRVSSRAAFAAIADRMAGLGVRRCIVSFPATMSLKGCLLPQYGAHGIRTAGIAEKTEWAAALVAAARERDLDLFLCCQPDVVKRLGGAAGAASCLDPVLAADLHPSRIEFPAVRDRSQRRHCRCGPSVDIGSYSDHPCGTGCAYCYSRAGGPRPRGGA